jgi:hypothetical protein
MRFWLSKTSQHCKLPPTGLVHRSFKATRLLDADPEAKFSQKERQHINLSPLYAIGQIEYCRNFIFKRNFPIHKIFERSCEIGLWRLTANRISELFGLRLTKQRRGKLGTVVDQIDHGHHVFRAYWKNAFLKQYEKFCTFLRNQLCSNNLHDFGLNKGLPPFNAAANHGAHKIQSHR